MSLPIPVGSISAAARQVVIASLQQLLGDRLSTAASIRERHGKDASYHPCVPPEAVAFPHSTQEVSEIVQICACHKVPLIPFGGGTSLEGHVAALRGGGCIDTAQMNRIPQVRADDFDSTVEAGVTIQQLNEHLRDSGLFFSVDPGAAAQATLGGMAATRASGTNTVRYGTMRENVLALTVVLPDRRIIRTARRARKSSAGYDLTRATCSFPSVAAAVRTAIRTIQAGVPVARMELANAAVMDAVKQYSKLDRPVAPTLWLNFHGTKAGVAEEAEMVRKIAAAQDGANFCWTPDPEGRRRMWQARYDAFYAFQARYPGTEIWVTDACVPISRLAECITETEEDLAASELPAAILGHVGDGNFHVNIPLHPADAQEIAAAERLNKRLVRRALALEGTCTGEHGIGYGKMDFLIAEHGEAVSVMHAIKQALDPDNLMNPGKILRI